MSVAGIDPGKSGALFILSDDGLDWQFDVPTAMVKVAGKKTKRAVPLYADWFAEWVAALRQARVTHIFIEKVGGGSIGGQKQGGSSMFSFGYTAGFVEAIVIAAGIPYSYLTPQKWRKAAGLSGAPDGNKSRARASQLFPSYGSWWPLVKHDGRAEAALIAWAGKHLSEGQANETDDNGQRSSSSPSRAPRTRKHKGRRKSAGR